MPALRRTAGESPVATVTVGWFELFYDLVVVASVSLGSHVYGATPTWGMGTWLASSLILLMVFWLLTVLSHNLFPDDDPLRRILVVAQMVALIVASLSLGRGQEGLPDSVGFGALFIAFASIALLYLRCMRTAAAGPRRAAALISASCGSAAFIMLIGAFLPDTGTLVGNPVTWAFAIGVLVAALPLLTVVLGTCVRTGSLNVHHLNERFGQLVLIVLGESFISLVFGLTGASTIPNPLCFIVDFIVVFAIWSLYFTEVLPAGVPAMPARLRIWLACQFVLLFGAIASAAGFAALTLIPFGSASGESAHWTPLPLFYVMLGLLGLRLAGLGARDGLVITEIAVLATAVLTVLALWVTPAAALMLTLIAAAIVASAATIAVIRNQRAG